MMKQWKKQKLFDSIGQQATNQNFAKIAQITAIHTGGYYDVELTSGIPITNIVCLDFSVKFGIGSWVTVEFYGGDWAIVGRSAYKGGD